MWLEIMWLEDLTCVALFVIVGGDERERDLWNHCQADARSTIEMMASHQNTQVAKAPCKRPFSLLGCTLFHPRLPKDGVHVA